MKSVVPEPVIVVAGADAFAVLFNEALVVDLAVPKLAPALGSV
jgi:hypothetical protein